jgi:alkylresorcinol/alkylpyrone synthase
MTGVALLSLATAVPPHVLRQDEVLARAQAMFGDRYPEFRRMAAVFRTTGITQRHSVAPPEWFDEPHGWPDRNEMFWKARATCSSRPRVGRWRTRPDRAEVDAV